MLTYEALVEMLDAQKRQILVEIIEEVLEKTLARHLGAPIECVETSGPEGIRTLDLFNAIEARSQLRHRPKPLSFFNGGLSPLLWS